MRIGQILIEADLVTAKQLSTGLEYGSAKHIALGRVLKLLKIMDEDDIERALQTQKLIRMGLSPVVAMAALKKAVVEKMSLEAALQGRYQEYLNGAVTPPPADAKPNFVDVDYSASPDKLIEKGDKLLLEDKCADAEAHYVQARLVQEKLLGRNHINIASVLIRLGNAYMATGRFKEAEECYEEVLILRMRAFPSDDPQIAQAHENLADLHVAWGNEADAMESFQQALDILEKKLPAQLGIYASILRKIAAAVKAPTNEPKKQPIGELLTELPF